jgi:hypothetical protein
MDNLLYTSSGNVVPQWAIDKAMFAPVELGVSVNARAVLIFEAFEKGITLPLPGTMATYWGDGDERQNDANSSA